MLTTEESTHWDLQNFELCVQKILEHAGFKIIRRSSATLKGINFLAKGQNDSGELHGVSCISQRETLRREDLEAIVAEGNFLSCQSNFIISLTPISPEAKEWAKENSKISLVDQRTFLHAYHQLPDEVKNEIEDLATTEIPDEISDPEIPAESPPPLSEDLATTEFANEISGQGIPVESPPPLPGDSEVQASDNPQIEVREEAKLSSNFHHREPTDPKERAALSKTNWRRLMVSGGTLICLFLLVKLGAVVVRALSNPGKPPGIEIVEEVLQKKPEPFPGDDQLAIPGGETADSGTPAEVAATVPDGGDPVVPDEVAPPAPDEVKPMKETDGAVLDFAKIAPAVPNPVVPVEPASEVPDAPEIEFAHKASEDPEPPLPGGNSSAMINEGSFAATGPPAPSIPTSAFAPAEFPDNKSFAYVDLKIPPDAPTWKSAERDDLERLLKNVWALDRLDGDPFFDLGQAILTRNLAGGGPLTKDDSMALWALGGKLKDYPRLGCGALTILSPLTVEHYLSSLEPAIRDLQDPFLSFQVASTKAGLAGQPQSSGEALDSLKRILQSAGPGQLPDSIAFFLLAGEFASGLRIAAPEEFMDLVKKSTAIPGWLKDYVEGQVLYSRAGKDGLVRVAEMITKFESSWESNPGHPAAAAELIMLTSIVSGGELSEIRRWFDRSIKAQADYKTAYFNYAKALAASGDPSARLEIEFGKSCCRTGRFDTPVPLTLIDAHTLRCAELGKTPSEYWSSLAESDTEDLKALFQKLGETDQLPYEAAVEKSLESVIWYFAGDKEKSAQCLKEENFVFDPRAFDSLKIPAPDRKDFDEFLKINGP